jgi:hypothetical protein
MRPLLRHLLLGLALGPLCGCRDGPAAPECVWGRRGTQAGDFVRPRACAIDPSGRLYVVDFTARIQVYDRDGHYLTGWSTPDYRKGRPLLRPQHQAGHQRPQAAAGHLRGWPVAEPAVEAFMGRLRARTAPAGEGPGGRPARRFEGGPGGVAPAGAEPSSAPPALAGPPTAQPAAPQPEEAGDYTSRLMQAKMRVWEERNKEGGT